MKKNEERTRAQVGRAILENGPQSAVQLSERLGLTPAAIRRHLDELVEEGSLEAREPYRSAAATRGRGRPSKVFLLTDSGRARFEHSYDDLALSALTFLEKSSGGELLAKFARDRAEKMIARAASRSSQVQSVEVLAASLNAQGYSSTIKSTAIGLELCQHHCPIAHAATEFPELCEAETQAFSELLGTHVQRLATIARGDGVCTTFIPRSTQSSSHSAKKTSGGAS